GWVSDWSSDVCSADLVAMLRESRPATARDGRCSFGAAAGRDSLNIATTDDASTRAGIASPTTTTPSVDATSSAIPIAPAGAARTSREEAGGGKRRGRR